MLGCEIPILTKLRNFWKWIPKILNHTAIHTRAFPWRRSAKTIFMMIIRPQQIQPKMWPLRSRDEMASGRSGGGCGTISLRVQHCMESTMSQMTRHFHYEGKIGPRPSNDIHCLYGMQSPIHAQTQLRFRQTSIEGTTWMSNYVQFFYYLHPTAKFIFSSLSICLYVCKQHYGKKCMDAFSWNFQEGSIMAQEII